MVLKSKLGINLSKIFLGYEILEILITTDAQHSTCASCNLLQRIAGILSYPYKTAKSRLLRTAREQNDEMVEYWAEKIVLECLRIDKPLNELKICVILWFAKQIRFSFSTNLSLEP